MAQRAKSYKYHCRLQYTRLHDSKNQDGKLRMSGSRKKSQTQMNRINNANKMHELNHHISPKKVTQQQKSQQI